MGDLKKQKLPARKKHAIVLEGTEPKRGKRAVSTPTAVSCASETETGLEPLGATYIDYSDGEIEEPALQPMMLNESTILAVKKEVRHAARHPAGKTKLIPAGAGVLYLGHIPQGFCEEQMRGFFSQFGGVSRVRLARNKRTGRSKHYAFVEFKEREVCEIVARAMDGYLLFSRVLVAKVVDPSHVHSETFKGARRPFKVVDRSSSVRKQHNRMRTAEEASTREERLRKADRKKRAAIASLGLEYTFGGYEAEAVKGGKRSRGVLNGDAAEAMSAERKRKSRPEEGGG